MVGHGDATEDQERGLQSTVEKKVKKPQGWRCMPFIIGSETFEKAASFAVGANLTLYLTRRYGVGQVDAANIATIFFGTTNFAPLVGAFLSDAYLGRFRTLAAGCLFTAVAMVGMTLTASLPGIRPAHCFPSPDGNGDRCTGATKLQLGAVYLSLALGVIGAGAVRPCSLPFGVDQFDRSDPKALRGLDSFYNWYYGTTTAALVFAMTILVYLQTVNWAVGFAVPSVLMLVAIALFFLGAPPLRPRPAGGHHLLRHRPGLRCRMSEVAHGRQLRCCLRPAEEGQSAGAAAADAGLQVLEQGCCYCRRRRDGKSVEAVQCPAGGGSEAAAADRADMAVRDHLLHGHRTAVHLHHPAGGADGPAPRPERLPDPRRLRLRALLLQPRCLHLHL